MIASSHPADMDVQLLLDLCQPRLPDAAVRRLHELVDASYYAIDFGMPGGLTPFLAERCRFVLGVTDNDAWFDKVERRLRLDDVINKSQLYRRSVDELPELTRRLQPAFYDVISIGCGPPACRPYLFAACQLLVRPGGILVVDNYAQVRRPYDAPRWECETFDDPRWPGGGAQILYRPYSDAVVGRFARLRKAEPPARR